MKETDYTKLVAERDALKARVEKLEREWLEEHRIIKLLEAAGFVTEQKISQARELASSLR